MGRYIYLGPYSMIEIDDMGTKKSLFMGEANDIEDDALVQDQIRRGFHLFETVGAAVEAPAPEVVVAEEPAAAGEPPAA